MQTHPMPRRHPIGRGWYWTRGGFDLFLHGRGASVGMLLCWLAIGLLLEMLPIGGAISNLLYMVWMAGWMAAAERAWREQKIRFDDLFTGFRQQFRSLLAGGVVLILALLPIEILSSALLSHWDPVQLLQSREAINLTFTVDEIRAVLLAISLSMLMAVPLLMAVTFAPALILLQKVPVHRALWLSFVGCLRNMWPFLTWSLLACVLLLLSSMLLVVGLLVVIPMLNYSVYVAYRDIFTDGQMPVIPPSEATAAHFDA